MNRDLPVKKSVLITGCSSGIGFATARYLAEKGFLVFATVRKEADAEKLRHLKLPNLIPVCPLDLVHLDDIPFALQTVQAKLQSNGVNGLYALINNAGGGMVAPAELMDLSVFRNELQTRLVGALGIVQAFLPLLRQESGRILWISTPAIIPTPYVTSIHACDFAVNCLARTLEIELNPWHIHNIRICCGGIKTDKGMQTTQEAAMILQHPRGELYRQSLTAWADEMTEFDRKRTPPEEVAKVIYKALSVRRPKKLYSIGYMAGFARLLELFPQSLTDKILQSRF